MKDELLKEVIKVLEYILPLLNLHDDGPWKEAKRLVENVLKKAKAE